MKTTRVRLSKAEAKHLGLATRKKDCDGRNARYTLNALQVTEVISFRGESVEAEEGFDLPAWDAEGKIMDIEQFCKFHTLPMENIEAYNLCTHLKTPTYNIRWRPVAVQIADLNYDFIEQLIKKHIVPIAYAPVNLDLSYRFFDRCIYTDLHIGMTPDKSGHALYGGKWDADEVMATADIIAQKILSEQKGRVLIIDELGDLVDGWNGETTRKGHKLPQNMDNQAMFDTAVAFKLLLASKLAHRYEHIVMNNICEDNHAGSFGYVVNSAVKSILELQYDNVKVVNHQKFINHYVMGKHCFVISHGKDSHALKFGFKPHLDPKQIEKIDGYLKHNGIYKQAEFIEFSKGDSHQMLLDYCTSDDFDYFNYPALSPSSEWIQTNFKKGRRGFVVQHVDYDSNHKEISPYFFPKG